MSEKEEYRKALASMRKLLEESKSGQSWWQPPRADYYYTCDMGYVEEFFESVEEWLSNS